LKRILVTLVAELAVDLSTPRHQLRTILPEPGRRVLGGLALTLAQGAWSRTIRVRILENRSDSHPCGEAHRVAAARRVSAMAGLHYLRDMFSGQAKLSPSNNDRYPKAPLDVRREKPLVTHQLTSSLTWQQLPEETQNCSSKACHQLRTSMLPERATRGMSGFCPRRRKADRRKSTQTSPSRWSGRVAFSPFAGDLKRRHPGARRRPDARSPR